MQNDTLVAVDIAKEVFEVGVSDRPGRVARRSRLQRYQFLGFFAQLPQATVVMEACGSAHYWARRIEELGPQVGAAARAITQATGGLVPTSDAQSSHSPRAPSP